MWWRKSPRLYLKNQNWAYLWINSLKFDTVCLSRGLLKTLKLRSNSLVFISHKAFMKNKRSGTSLLASFSTYFSRKLFLTFYSINLPNFIVWAMLGNMCTVIVCFPGYDVINFEITLSLLIKPFSHVTKRVRTKT